MCINLNLDYANPINFGINIQNNIILLTNNSNNLDMSLFFWPIITFFCCWKISTIGIINKVVTTQPDPVFKEKFQKQIGLMILSCCLYKYRTFPQFYNSLPCCMA